MYSFAREGMDPNQMYNQTTGDEAFSEEPSEQLEYRHNQPQTYDYYDPSDEYTYMVEKRAAAVTQPEHMARLAKPKQVPEYPERKANTMSLETRTSDSVKAYKPSERILAMARPQQREMALPPREISEIGKPSPQALKYQASERMQVLATPINRDHLYPSLCRKNAFKVKKSALKASCPENLARLAKPKEKAEDRNSVSSLPRKWPQSKFFGSYQPSKRIQELAQSHERNNEPNTIPLEAISKPSPAALAYQASPRIRELATPRRPNSRDMHHSYSYIIGYNKMQS